MRGCAAFRLQREQSLYSIVAISLRKKKHIDTQSCSPQRWRCDYHHALPWVVYTQGAVSASAACAPLPKKTQTTTYENKIIKEAGTHW